MKATKYAGLQPAMDWLLEHADDPEDDDEEEPAQSHSLDATPGQGSTAAKEEETSTAEGASLLWCLICLRNELDSFFYVAASLQCDDCQTLLKSADAAQLHAVRTGHQSFSQSTQVIPALTGTCMLRW